MDGLFSRENRTLSNWCGGVFGLQDKHSSNGVRPVSLLPERNPQFPGPLLHLVRFDLREVLPIDTRHAPVRAALGLRVRQHILAIDLVVKRMEANPGFCLRFSV